MRSASRLLAVGFVLLAAFTLHAAAAPLRVLWFTAFNYGVYYALLTLATIALSLRARQDCPDRRAWTAIALGSGLWLLGDVVYTVHPAPSPAPSDVLYLAFYPCLYFGLMLLVRRRVRRLDRSLWLDGLAAALATAGLAATVVFEPIRSATGGAVGVVLTNLTYPAADGILLAAVAGVFAISGRRPGRTWAWVGASLVLLTIGDSIYLLQTATGTYAEGRIVDALWPGGMLLLALGAWQREERQPEWRLGSTSVLAGPALGSVVAVGVLVAGLLGRAAPLAQWLALAALAAAVVRGALTIRENRRLLEVRELEALTDALTGLGNRRRLLTDLERVLADGEAEHLLAMFDLDGFKRYNDTFGHPAGDTALVQAAKRLSVLAGGNAYRLGGDEFCTLVATRDAAALLAELTEALRFEHNGYELGASRGACLLPLEAGNPSDALRLVDMRLYRDKAARAAEAGTFVQGAVSEASLREVLVQTVHESDPALSAHNHSVASLGVGVGEELGLSQPALRSLEQAALFHDVGKLALPDAILQKPGPLDDGEWQLIYRHTLIGERILSASPELAAVARIVRSSHERWDGAGYPDGLDGEAIPIEARILAACDAYDAMTNDRPYRDRSSVPAALDELARCAGSQFDPDVVRTLLRVVQRGAAELPARERRRFRARSIPQFAEPPASRAAEA